MMASLADLRAGKNDERDRQRRKVVDDPIGDERWRHRPAAVVLVPGILLLVPGSIGFRSLTALMEQLAASARG